MLLSPAEVGMFALAAKLADSLSYLPQGMALALVADLAQSNAAAAHRIAGAAIRLALAFTAAGGVVLYGFCAGVLPLFMPKVSATLDLIPTMFVASAALSPMYILWSLGQATGDSRTVLVITIWAFCLKLAMLATAVGIGGLTSAPLAILIASICSVALAAWKVSDATKQPILELFTPRRGDWVLARHFIRLPRRKADD
jgi:O-antigen/teichoic acid export membrane protein